MYVEFTNLPLKKKEKKNMNDLEKKSQIKGKKSAKKHIIFFSRVKKKMLH